MDESESASFMDKVLRTSDGKEIEEKSDSTTSMKFKMVEVKPKVSQEKEELQLID